jgi:hypothetical protein
MTHKPLVRKHEKRKHRLYAASKWLTDLSQEQKEVGPATAATAAGEQGEQCLENSTARHVDHTAVISMRITVCHLR